MKSDPLRLSLELRCRWPEHCSDATEKLHVCASERERRFDSEMEHHEVVALHICVDPASIATQ